MYASATSSRPERQRAVLKAILDKALPSSEVKGLIHGLGIHKRGQVQSLHSPINGFGRSSDGQSIAIVDEAKLAEVSQALREDKMADYLAKYPKD